MNTANASVVNRSWGMAELSPRRLAFYVCVAALVGGNLLAPQLCHLAALGGKTWLPIYFFTLVGAWCFGWRAGVLTALLSPVANSLLFGMPGAEMLPVILIKSVLLAAFCGGLSRWAKSGAQVFTGIVLAVVAYQLLGGAAEAALMGTAAALQDIRIGWPGLLVQVVGGFAVVMAWRGR